MTEAKYILIKKPFDGRAHDLINKDESGSYRPVYGSAPIEEILQRDPSLVVVPYAEYEALYLEFLQSKVTAPVEISEEDYWYCLEALPPCRWGVNSGVEMFHFMEAIQGTLVSWFAKYQGKYYKFTDHSHVDQAEVVRKVVEAAK